VTLVVVMALRQLFIAQDWEITNLISDSISSISTASSWKVRKIHRNVNFYNHHVVYWRFHLLISKFESLLSGNWELSSWWSTTGKLLDFLFVIFWIYIISLNYIKKPLSGLNMAWHFRGLRHFIKSFVVIFFFFFV
jgi:hypothetical protein